MSTLTLDNGALVWQTGYNPALVADFKTRIPPSDRQWDAARKAWRVAPQHGQTLALLTEQHLGERITVPAIGQTVNQTQTRILEVRYIGATKDRGGDERSAFGYVNGAWSVIFPEAVLREWFDAPARPDEETTLYQVLGVRKDVCGADLKAAYRRLSRQWHPDVCSEPGASEVFMRIKDAYDLLSDPSKRARYDAGLVLAASIHGQNEPVGLLNAFMPLFTYRSPLRCGLLMCDGQERLARFLVSKILAWQDIEDSAGRVLSVSWPVGSDKPVEVWA
jgi:hypothetical protein